MSGRAARAQVASFGHIQYLLLDGGFCYVNLTAFPERVDETVDAAMAFLRELETRAVPAPRPSPRAAPDGVRATLDAACQISTG